MMLMTAGMIGREDYVKASKGEGLPDFSQAALDMYRGFAAPFKDLPDEAFNGARRFPLSIPLDSYHNGNAAAQESHYKTLLNWNKGAHFIWGCTDDVFVEAWGKKWADQMNARFDALEDAGHFLQNTHGKEIVDLIMSY